MALNLLQYLTLNGCTAESPASHLLSKSTWYVLQLLSTRVCVNHVGLILSAGFLRRYHRNVSAFCLPSLFIVKSIAQP